MSSEWNEKIYRMACDYANTHFRFARRNVNSVDKVPHNDERDSECYKVIMTLQHSEEEIDAIVCEGPEEEAQVKRSFLTGEFKVTLTIFGGDVVSVVWDDIDVC